MSTPHLNRFMCPCFFFLCVRKRRNILKEIIQASRMIRPKYNWIDKVRFIFNQITHSICNQFSPLDCWAWAALKATLIQNWKNRFSTVLSTIYVSTILQSKCCRYFVRDVRHSERMLRFHILIFMSSSLLSNTFLVVSRECFSIKFDFPFHSVVIRILFIFRKFVKWDEFPLCIPSYICEKFSE